MTRLSLAMIVQDDAETLERALTCAKAFCDELVVIDLGSTDKSVEIAEQAGAKVFHYAWNDNFADTRNYAFDCCTGDWILWLDADDTIPESEQAKILALKNTLLSDQLDVVCLSYDDYCPETHQYERIVYRERLIRKAAGLRWTFPLYERILHDDAKTVYHADIHIEHRPLSGKIEARLARNAEILQKVLQNGGNPARHYYLHAEALRLTQKNYLAAMAAYEQARALSELSWEQYAVLIGLSGCAFHLGTPDAGLQYLHEALLLDSQRAEAFIALGQYFFSQQQWQNALPFFRAASSLPKPGEGYHADADYSWLPRELLAHCYMHLGKFEEAASQMMDILPCHPYPAKIAEFLRYCVGRG